MLEKTLLKHLISNNKMKRKKKLVERIRIICGMYPWQRNPCNNQSNL